jgi:hypothetical protein
MIGAFSSFGVILVLVAMVLMALEGWRPLGGLRRWRNRWRDRRRRGLLDLRAEDPALDGRDEADGRPDVPEASSGAQGRASDQLGVRP